jgi:hypothetical protein
MVPTYRDTAPTELLRESYRTLEKELYNAVDQERHDVDGDLPDGTTLAITLQPLPVPDDLRYGKKTSFFAAVSHITSTPGVPALVAPAVLTYFGDWGYSYPKTLHLQHLPGPWHTGFDALRHEAIPLTDGYDDTTDDGDLADAWPTLISELLISRDPGTSALVAWALTADGAVHPLPTSQALRDFPGLARAALTAEGSSRLHSRRLDALLGTITPDTGRTLNYTEAVMLLTQQDA